MNDQLIQTNIDAEARFSVVFDFCPASMAIRDLAELKYVDVNKAWLAMTKFAKSDVLGKTATELNIIDNFLIWLQNNDVSMCDSDMLEVMFKTRLGEQRTGLWTFKIIQINQTPHVLTSIVDITEKKQIEREMARLESLNVIGEMAASIAHEVRNPMTTIRGYIQLFQRKAKFHEYEETFHVILDEIDRANAIITEFLSLAKNKRFNFNLCNLNDILVGFAPLLEADAVQTGCKLDLVITDTPDIYADADSIRQVIINLARNSFDAMCSGGLLTIRSYTRDDKVILEVKDTGCGIAANILDKVWQPFYTTKEHGTGLGLPVCYRIAERHGASIEIQSSSAGTSVSVFFKVTTMR